MMAEPTEGRLFAGELADYLRDHVRRDAEVRVRHGGETDPATGLIADFHVAGLMASGMPPTDPPGPPQVLVLTEGGRVDRPRAVE
jgi:hypothetical protein